MNIPKFSFDGIQINILNALKSIQSWCSDMIDSLELHKKSSDHNNLYYTKGEIIKALESTGNGVNVKQNRPFINELITNKIIPSVDSTTAFQMMKADGKTSLLDEDSINDTIFFPKGRLKFPSTQNASSDVNTLDDYKEGTWTPILNGFTIIGATTLVGKYTKIGRIVYWEIDIFAATSIASTAGTSYISGLQAAVGSAIMSSSFSITDTNGAGVITGIGLTTTTPNLFTPNWAASGLHIVGNGFYFMN